MQKTKRSLLTACSPLAQESRASSSSCSHGSFRRWRGRQLGSFQKKKKEGSSDSAGPKYIRRSSTARVDGPAGPKGPGFFGSGPAQQPAETEIRCGGPGVTWLGGGRGNRLERGAPPHPLLLALPPVWHGSWRASRSASRALSNVCFRTGFTREVGSEAVGGLHRQGEVMKSWLHVVYTSI